MLNKSWRYSRNALRPMGGALLSRYFIVNSISEVALKGMPSLISIPFFDDLPCSFAS
jgi:hypothetical protein